MQCPRCGYVLTPFDERCPKCSHRPAASSATATAQRLPDPMQTRRMDVLQPGPPPAAPAQRLPGPAPASPAERLPDPLQVRRVATPDVVQPVPVAGVTPGPFTPARSPNRALWIALLLLLAIPLAGGLWMVAGKRSDGGLRLVSAAGGRGGNSLVQAPAITTDEIGRRLMGAGAITGEVEVSLAWDTLSDFDLEVRAPTGETVWARNPRAQCGGVQDVDANPTLLTPEGSRRTDAGQVVAPGDVMEVPENLVDIDKNNDLPPAVRDLLSGRSGLGGDAPTRFTRSPVEHVYFAQAPRGVYTVLAHCYSWREKDRQPEPFTIQVRSRGQTSRMSGTLGPQSYITDLVPPTAMCQFEVR